MTDEEIETASNFELAMLIRRAMEEYINRINKKPIDDEARIEMSIATELGIGLCKAHGIPVRFN